MNPLPTAFFPSNPDLEGGESPADHLVKRRKAEHNDKFDVIDSPPVNGNLISSDISPWQPSKWQATIEKVIKAIVSIRFCQIASFDTDGPMTSQASGFIVDAENGIILTNRHVVCPGPFVGEAICHDHEEIDVYPVYRDPVHDFGFLKFDPKKIKYMSVTQIELRPELAKVGLDIRVVGNDAGEKLSILAGSISRLDRNAPHYGELTYNDFNTFYLQAASSTSGGSSGSPVIDMDGNAVALQAGGRIEAATDFFLPLDRIKRALSFVQRGEPVPRGDIQLQLVYRPYDEARRLGLRTETEEKMRGIFKDDIGVLVAEILLPEGPTHGKIEEGDIVLTVNGQYISRFAPFEEILDTNVGREITIGVERGGTPLEFTIQVDDLHAITPDRYVEVGGALLHELSYQLARFYGVPCKGVYVADPSGMFRLDGSGSGWIIKSVDDKPTPTLDAFIEVMKRIPDRERVSVVYYSIEDTHTTLMCIARNERHWSNFRLAVRNDKTGLWDFTDLGKPIPPRVIAPSTKQFITLDDSMGPAKDLIKCLVKVHFNSSSPLDGHYITRTRGAGIVIDKERGYVVVSRNSVPTSIGDVILTFADAIVVPAKIVYLHPTANFTIVQYDPAVVGETDVRSANFGGDPLQQGQKVTLVACNQNYRPICLTTAVTDTSCISIGCSGAPRFRSINLDVVTLDTPLASQCTSGLLADENGTVRGLWLSFMGERDDEGNNIEYNLGIDYTSVKLVLDRLQNNEDTTLRSLNVELVPVQMAQTEAMGLSSTWARRVEEANPHKHQLFMIRRTEACSESGNVLRELDVILAVNGKLITRLSDINVQMDEVEMTILREKQELTVRVKTSLESGEGTSRVVSWAGAVLQEPHKAVLLESKTLPSRIYITAVHHGSPACLYGLGTTLWVTHINGAAVVTLDDFIEAVTHIQDGTYVRLRCITFDNIPTMFSVKMVNHYFPLVALTKDSNAECGWTKKKISS